MALKPIKPKLKTAAAVVAVNDPLSSLEPWEFKFCMQLAMNVSQRKAYAAARPDLDEDTIKSNAYRVAGQDRIRRAVNSLREAIPEARRSIYVMERLELEAFLTRAIITPLADLDDDDPLVVEKRRVMNANGVTDSIKKVDPLKAASDLAKLKGWTQEAKGGDVIFNDSRIIAFIRRPGVPQEGLDTTDLELLSDDDDDEVGSESRP